MNIEAIIGLVVIFTAPAYLAGPVVAFGGSDVISRAAGCYHAVIGGTGEGKMARMRHLPIHETVARCFDRPLVMCRAAARIRGWNRRYT